jgi:hypothetical protein
MTRQLIHGMCRFHGGRAGAPEGKRNGRYRHGLRIKEMLAERRYVAELMQEAWVP